MKLEILIMAAFLVVAVPIFCAAPPTFRKIDTTECSNLAKQYQDAVNVEQARAIDYLNAKEDASDTKFAWYVEAKSKTKQILNNFKSLQCPLAPIKEMTIDEIKAKVTVPPNKERLNAIISGENDRKKQETDIKAAVTTSSETFTLGG